MNLPQFLYEKSDDFEIGAKEIIDLFEEQQEIKNSNKGLEKNENMIAKLDKIYNINEENITLRLKLGYEKYKEKNNEINKKHKPFCTVQNEENSLYYYLAIDFIETHTHKLVEIFKTNMNANQKMMCILCCFITGIQEFIILKNMRYIVKKQEKNIVKLLLANQKLSLMQSAFHYIVLKMFFLTMKPSCIKNFSLKADKLWHDSDAKDTSPLAIYLIFKCVFDNLIVNQIPNETIAKQQLKMKFYNINPNNMKKNFKYYDIEIEYSPKFLLGFFGDKFYSAFMKNKKKLEDKFNLKEETFFKFLQDGFNEFKMLEVETQNYFENDKTPFDFFYVNYIFLLEEKIELLKKITQFKINPNEKMLLIILIIITHVEEKQKPYFGQTDDIECRKGEYKGIQRRPTKFVEFHAKYPMKSLELSTFKSSKKFSLVLETLLIRFTGMENTLNSVSSTIEIKIFNEITKKCSIEKTAVYCLVLIIYSKLINNTM